MSEQSITKQAVQAKQAASVLALLSTEEKNHLLQCIAKQLRLAQDDIEAANDLDLQDARAAGLSAALIDRLLLKGERFVAMCEAVLAVTKLPDPVGAELSRYLRADGLLLTKVSTPIGLIAIIFESRPNVTADAAALCLKAGNSVILRGGKEALRTNVAIGKAISAALVQCDLPQTAVCVIDSTDREAVRELVQLENIVDLVIPRGGEQLIRAVVEAARVPVIKHYKGVCHVYVDDAADQEMALAIIENGKCQRPGVCNAVETLLVHRGVAEEFLPKVFSLLTQRGVSLRGCEETRKLLPQIEAATEADWEAEYLDLILSIKVVDSLAAAIDHINHYGSHHSDCIVTENTQSAAMFLKAVDSAAVYHNASTRFTDGGEFGLGAEIGISTDKLHARGPMGLQELTTYKYLCYGSGQVRG